MRKIKAQKLTRDAFRPYGDYVELLRPASFYRFHPRYAPAAAGAT